MPGKRYTHSAGFNVTSLKGLKGIYIFYGANNEIIYAGSCEDKKEEIENWKKRFQSHTTYSGQKLTLEVKYMDVIIPNQDISYRHLLVLEYLLIWYLRPPKNRPKGSNTPWKYFKWNYSEETVKWVAWEKYKFEIIGSIHEFLKSYDFFRIQREWEDNGKFKRYGDFEQLDRKKIPCTGKRNCICFNCLSKKRHRKLRL